MARTVKRFQFTQRDPNTIKRQATQRGGDFDSLLKEGTKIFKPKEGKNTVRILPPTWANADHYGYEVFINYQIGSDSNSYFSLKAMKGVRDPLDEARKQAEREGNKDLSNALKPTKRIIFYLIDRNAEEEGPQIWMAPWTFDKKLAALSIDEDSGAVIDPPIDHHEEGCDIRFYYEKTGKQFPDYPAEKMRIMKPSALHEDEKRSNEWLDYVSANPIPEILNFYDYEHIAAAFDGHIASRDDDMAATRRPKPATGKPPWDEDEKPQRTSAKAPMDEDETDEETGPSNARSNGKVGAATKSEDAEGEDTKTSIASIKARLAGRRSRVQVDED